MGYLENKQGEWNVRQTQWLYLKTLDLPPLPLEEKCQPSDVCRLFSPGSRKAEGRWWEQNKMSVFHFFQTCHFINAGISDRREARILNQCPTLMGKGDFCLLVLWK